MAPSDPVVVELPVRFRDCDAMGHVNNAVYLTYFEVARGELWRRLADPWKPGDFPFILAEVTVSFRSPARYGETLRVSIGVDKLGTKSWLFTYRIDEASSGREVASGRSVQVYYDYATGSTLPIPDQL